jgi:phage I-like protein
MLSASSAIQQSAIQMFSGKKIRIFPHNDQAGFKAARKWTAQLQPVVEAIDYFAFNRFDEVNDLADLNKQALTNNPNISEVVV